MCAGMLFIIPATHKF